METKFNFNKLDWPGRPSNADICAAFRALLTDGFYVTDVDGVPSSKSHTLTATKPWRGELWKAFREIEKRLCPQPEDFK